MEIEGGRDRGGGRVRLFLHAYRYLIGSDRLKLSQYRCMRN